ncbi:hypothetical protein PPERSA_10562 [Pseudocohnilembus persalinus]|uniref:Amino acid transporter transmembrane domain-containing protein n=1 Tax=Pseudocohnilembus persalinus TaxID=266149 RepID=A0A0V0Q9P4_PSEPJ|nr:hypothetical protein PPERSA_10562 [Pseudocohnilembus persalinus]|eukprot:KRW98791.1 hypothetical protein PPERSA_10562 [Pseudocohnilembus persalinus]
MAAIVYFMLQNQVLYAFIKFIFFYADENKELPEINTINFSQFSVQYQCIVLAIPVFFVISMKDLSFIIKLGQYGVLAVTAYGLYITYLFIYNLSIPDFSVNWGEVKLFPTDISSIVLVMGNFGLAFFIHSGINTILANSKDQSKNIRNVSFGYLNVLIIYGLIGVFGSIGIINLDWQQDGIQTVSQLFDRQDILPAIINCNYGN